MDKYYSLTEVDRETLELAFTYACGEIMLQQGLVADLQRILHLPENEIEQQSDIKQRQLKQASEVLGK